MLSKKILSPILAIALLSPSMGYANYFTKGLKYGASLGAIQCIITSPVEGNSLSSMQKLNLSISLWGALEGAIKGGIIGFGLDLVCPEQPNQQKK